MKKTICAGGFIQKGNKFLFGKRSGKKDWGPRRWDIVGGRSRKNEHPLFTLRREAKEELGIEVLNATLITTMDIKDKDGMLLFEYHIYNITNYKGTPVNCSKEHSKIKWISKKELSVLRLALPEYANIINLKVC